MRLSVGTNSKLNIHMKKFIFSLACLLPLAALAQDGYTITGKIGTLNAPSKAYLLYYKLDMRSRITDSAEIKDGLFLFKGQVETLAWAQLTIKHDAAAPQKGATEDALFFCIENTNITITSPDSVKNATISGSVV